jgi:hypothetical protein
MRVRAPTGTTTILVHEWVTGERNDQLDRLDLAALIKT